jgi:hypothetical protein
MSKPKKYYLGFLYTNIAQLHCTHCYFGTLNRSNLQAVKVITDCYFQAYGPIKMPTVLFNASCFFGSSKPTRVLLTSNVEAFNPMKGLRDRFNAAGMLTQTYPFRPHVTTQALEINLPFKNYSLVENGNVIQSWPIWGMTP